jgi:hypothetical protein
MAVMCENPNISLETFSLGKSKDKAMLEAFFDAQGPIHYEFIKEEHTVNKYHNLPWPQEHSEKKTSRKMCT